MVSHAGIASSEPSDGPAGPRASRRTRIATLIKTLAVATAGFVAGKVADSSWEQLFPPEDLTPKILKVSEEAVREGRSTRDALLREVDALPDRIAASANPSAEVQRLKDLVSTLGGYVATLGDLNSAAVRVARGEEVSDLPDVAPAPVSSFTVNTAPRDAFLPPPFIAGGVGIDTLSPAEQAADLDPNIFARVGERRLLSDRPQVWLVVTGTGRDTQDLLVTIGDQPWRMPPGSFVPVSSVDGDCKLTFMNSRTSLSRQSQVHRFWYDCPSLLTG